jgi:hypothetical protein
MDRLSELASPLVVSESIALHKNTIEAVKSILLLWVNSSSDPNLKKAVEAAPLDDLFILRFVLSHNQESAAKIAEYVQKTLTWRGQKHDLLIQVAAGACEPLRPMHNYMCRAFLGEFGGYCVFADRHGHNDVTHLGDLIKYYSSDDSVLDLSEALLIMNEFGFRKVDELSRRTNRLCKAINMTFLDHLPLRLTPNILKIINGFGSSSKKSSIYYPQFLGAGVMFSSESLLMKFVLKLSKNVMSETTMSKVVICPGFKKGVSPNACPGLKRLNPNLNWEEVFPACANGKGSTPETLKSRRYPEASSEEKTA